MGQIAYTNRTFDTKGVLDIGYETQLKTFQSFA